MKLSIVVPKLNLETGGGSHYTLYHICRGLRKLGSTINIYSLKPIQHYSAEIMSDIHVNLTEFDASDKGLETLAANNDDIFLVYGPLSIAYKLKKKTRERPVIAYFNQLGSFCTNLMKQSNNCWLTCSHMDRIFHSKASIPGKLKYAVFGLREFHELQRGFRSLDACIFDSSPLAESYEKIYKLSQKKCFIIPECINFEDVVSSQGEEEKTEEAINILFVSSLAHYKGIGLLFSALQKLSADWHVWIFGDGPDKPKVLAFQKEYPDRVHYHGHIENNALFRELVKRNYIYVHPCLWFEAFGRSIVEAMAHKIPVVVPDAGGPSWIIDHKINGIKYKHRDPEDLTRCINWLIENPAERKKISTAGYEKARSYHYEDISRLWHKTLTDVIDNFTPHEQ